jgi:hypothetical protein
MANGNTPYSPLHSLSWRCNQTSFSSFRSPFSRNTAAEAMSRAMAKWTLSCFCCAHCLARSLFTWYFTSFVLNMATACWNAAEYRGSVVLAATRRREARSSAQAPHSRSPTPRTTNLGDCGGGLLPTAVPKFLALGVGGRGGSP